MTARPIANTAASVHARLLASSRQTSADFQFELIRFGNERLLARIAGSEYATAFVLKGATLFALWTSTPHRPTRNIDLHGSGPNSPEHLKQLFREICGEQDAGQDGLVLRRDSVLATVIRQDQEYEGVRVTLLATLGNAKIPLQVDVEYGDAMYPPPCEIAMPSILGFPTGSWRTYQRETVVAEKFQAMVALGMGNSRMKDFFDLWILQRDFSFNWVVLAEAIRQTFERRRTPLPVAVPLALSATFASDVGKRKQWLAFLNRTRLEALALEAVVGGLATFLLPVAAASQDGGRTASSWAPGGPWDPRQ